MISISEAFLQGDGVVYPAISFAGCGMDNGCYISFIYAVLYRENDYRKKPQ